jgi:hypothetical protein
VTFTFVLTDPFGAHQRQPGTEADASAKLVTSAATSDARGANSRASRSCASDGSTPSTVCCSDKSRVAGSPGRQPRSTTRLAGPKPGQCLADEAQPYRTLV